jgi:hypothetical protein
LIYAGCVVQLPPCRRAERTITHVACLASNLLWTTRAATIVAKHHMHLIAPGPLSCSLVACWFLISCSWGVARPRAPPVRQHCLQVCLADALGHYYDAVGHNPQDCALFNNISLAALKMGDPHQVRECCCPLLPCGYTWYSTYCATVCPMSAHPALLCSPPSYTYSTGCASHNSISTCSLGG